MRSALRRPSGVWNMIQLGCPRAVRCAVGTATAGNGDGLLYSVQADTLEPASVSRSWGQGHRAHSESEAAGRSGVAWAGRRNIQMNHVLTSWCTMTHHPRHMLLALRHLLRAMISGWNVHEDHSSNDVN